MHNSNPLTYVQVDARRRRCSDLDDKNGVQELTIFKVAEKPVATHVSAAVVTETLNSTLSPSSLTSQLNM